VLVPIRASSVSAETPSGIPRCQQVGSYNSTCEREFLRQRRDTIRDPEVSAGRLVQLLLV
jgi:primosomal replication protein N